MLFTMVQNIEFHFRWFSKFWFENLKLFKKSKLQNFKTSKFQSRAKNQLFEFFEISIFDFLKSFKFSNRWFSKFWKWNSFFFHHCKDNTAIKVVWLVEVTSQISGRFCQFWPILAKTGQLLAGSGRPGLTSVTTAKKVRNPWTCLVKWHYFWVHRKFSCILAQTC